ncbi:putative leucine aminopeptidase 2 [Leucoagaricus sp. SymC.cos]|nr:putative leucine aminopeptidase 2 [Leucoagaricus sp. SymC.cos]
MLSSLLLFPVLAGLATAVGKPPGHGAPIVTSKALQSTVSGHSLFKHAEALSRFAEINGAHTRFAGSIGHNATVDYIKSTLDKTGYYDTFLQTFTYTFSEGNVTFSAGGTQFNAEYLTNAPAGSADAPLVVVSNLGCAASDFPADTAGKITLISRGNCTFSNKVALSGAAGAIGAIVYNNADGPVGSGQLGTTTNPLGPYVPAGSISGVDGQALVAAVRAGEVTASLQVLAIVEDRFTNNVIATSKLGDKNNIVFSGGHTDSVPAGPGINDNGSGSMSILELAVQLSNFSIKNAVRFGFWSAEEFGLLGSEHYVTSLPTEEQEKIALYLNFDMVASPNFGFFIYDGDGSAFNVSGPPGSDHIEKTFEDFFAEAGLKSGPTAFDGRSDYGPFLDVGIPSGGLFTGAEQNKTAEEVKLWSGEAGVPYDICYHQSCDTTDNLNVPAWIQNTKAISHAIATYATSLKGIPRGSGGEIRAIVERTPRLDPRRPTF